MPATPSEQVVEDVELATPSEQAVEHVELTTSSGHIVETDMMMFESLRVTLSSDLIEIAVVTRWQYRKASDGVDENADSVTLSDNKDRRHKYD